MNSFQFRSYLFSSIVIISITVVAIGAINLNTIKISKYQVEIPHRHSKINHLRVVFVADIHINQNISFRFINKFVTKVISLQPDLMLYGGDILEGDSENESSDKIVTAIKSIKTKYGTFGVTGNHEHYGGQEKGDFFQKAGINLLCDTVLRIDNSFYLVGRYDEHFRQRKIITQLMDSVSSDLPIILMDHRPTELDPVSHSLVDVQFSGHTHNGQMFPINLITNCIYELSWGYKKIRNTHFFVTSGLRLWGPPVRTAGKSEIIMVDIIFN